MTISELIKELEKVKAEHGDLEIGIVGEIYAEYSGEDY